MVCPCCDQRAAKCGCDEWDLKAALQEAKETIKALQEDSRILEALRAGGVDNWEGYAFAMDRLHDGN